MKLVFRNLYFISIFFVCLPSMFLLSSTLNTQNIAKGIWLLLFLTIFAIDKKKFFSFNKSYFLLVPLLFFMSQSLSVLNAQDLESFINRYRNIFFSIVFYIVSAYYIRTKEDIIWFIKILLSTISLNIFIEVAILINPTIFLDIAKLFIHPEYLESIIFNLARNRIYLDEYNEVVIPIVLYLLHEENTYFSRKTIKVLLVILLIFITIFSFLSGFRTKIIMAMLSLVGATFVLKKSTKPIYFLFLIFILVFSAYFSTIFSGGKSVLYRISTDFDLNSYSSGRVQRWEKALEIGMSSPITGVGLGNYYNYLSYQEQKSFSIFDSVKKQYDLAATDPHNIFFSIFAESGLIGLGAFITLVIYFIKRDSIILYTKETKLCKIFIISFWTIFIYSLLNPTISIVYQTYFWLFRILIEKSKKLLA